MKCYIEIDGIKVDSKILTAKFCCDYEKCKGACCHQPIQDVELLGGSLTDYEAAEILYNRRALALLCDSENVHIASEQPVTKDDDTFYTTLQNAKCVFCSVRKGTCILKMAHDRKIANIDIPLSCHLYPIVWELSCEHEQLRVENIFDKDYCVHAYEKGNRDGVFLLDFLKIPLIRGFGEDFYNKLKELQKEYL